MLPNIVFITCHDLGRHLGCYGQQTVNSPNLDALAADGVLFERSFCTAPQCSPSRAALHTGRHAHSNGMLGLAHDIFRWRLHATEMHMAQRLKAAGYTTALIGIQHVTGDTEAEVRALGYDVVHGTQVARKQGEDIRALLAELAESDQPFYLETGFFEPHRPYDWHGTPPDATKGAAVPDYLPDTPEAQAEFAAVQGMIRALDTGIGLIMQGLKENDLTANTWVIFVADHGLAMPRAKCTLYDPGIETALLMRWPDGGISGGRRYPQMVSHVDMVPTMLDGLGLPLPDNLHGRSYWPLLQGEDYQPNTEIYAEKTFHTTYEPMRAIRTETHKLIVNLDQDIAINCPSDVQKSPIYWQMIDQITPHRPHVELYDLRNDASEQHNLAGTPDAAGIERDLKARLLRWMEITGDPILNGPPPSNYYYDAMEQLRT